MPVSPIVASTAKKLMKAAKGKGPTDLNPTEDSLILVGDGGKDPAAEEYVYLPAGSGAIIAPKMSAKEKPSMSNAVNAIASTAIRGQLQKAQYGVRAGGGSGEGARGVRYRPATPAPVAATPNYGNMGAPLGAPSIPGGPAVPAAPYDPGIGPELQDAVSLLDTLDSLAAAPGISGLPGDANRFARRPGINFAAAQYGATALGGWPQMLGTMPQANGGGWRQRLLDMWHSGQLKQGMNQGGQERRMTAQPMPTEQSPRVGYTQALDRMKLQRAQYGITRTPILSGGGMVIGYKTAQAGPPPAPPPLSSGSGGSGSNSNSENNAAQKAIAQMQIDAQMKIASMTNATNMQRLALDRLLGQEQLVIDRQRAAEEAQQLLMTRAGRQLVAPGGNVIPSMQPSIGRSIN